MNTILLQAISNPDVNLQAILPETIVAVTGIIVMLYDVFAPKQKNVTTVISLIGLAIATYFTFSMWGAGPATSWNGMIATDPLRISFSLVLLFVAAMTILTSTVWSERETVPVGEYHALLLFATFGSMFMASGNDFVIIFLGLETLSIATYVMAGLRKSDLKSNESAMKYFILGSFASAFLLYGMALIYGATGTTNVALIAERIASPTFPGLLLMGGAMLVIGFGFKVATVPFHVWTPDVYEGAPSPVTGFMAAGPKAAAFASFMRVFVLGFPLIGGATAAGYLHESWVTALAVMAMLTMTVGNISAIVQNNVKRMLAYSSISHAGYAMVGFVGAGVAKTPEIRDAAIAAVAFYLLTYAVTNLGAFSIISLVGQKNDRRTEFDDYAGIGFKSPVIAFSLSLFMLSLLGLPMTAGFIGKVLVFRPALEAGSVMLTTMVVVAVVNTAISAYYYLRLIVVMFFRERTTDWSEPKMPVGVAAVLLITIIGVFYFGLFSGSWIEKFATPSAPAAVQAAK